MGLGAVRIGDPYRRDRMLLLNAVAIALLTLLGAAGEALGMDRRLKATRSSAASTHCFVKAVCITMPFPTCQKQLCTHSWTASKISSRKTKSQTPFFGSFEK